MAIRKIHNNQNIPNPLRK